jgi:hypothetical protein
MSAVLGEMKKIPSTFRQQLHLLSPGLVCWLPSMETMDSHLPVVRPQF